MSYCLIFCDSKKRSNLVFELVHEPIKELVKKTGWYVKVHMFDDDNIQVLLHTFNYKDRLFFRCKFNEIPKLMAIVIIRVYQITNLKY